MFKYQKLIAIVLLTELLLMAGANWLLVRWLQDDGNRTFKVEIQRASREIKEGTAPDEIDLKKYPSITSILWYDSSKEMYDNCIVRKIDGEWYQFFYHTKENHDTKTIMKTVNCLFLGCFAVTAAMSWYLGRTVIRPFGRMNELVKELARGNLSTPLKQEKTRYFGQFLWGLDMLRETLEEKKSNELKLLEEKKKLLLSISHDIKTPLSAIELYTRLLADETSDEKRSRALDGIGRNVGAIRDYVNEIVKTSREDILHFEVFNDEFYLNDLRETIVSYYMPKMEEKHVRFEVEKVNNCLLYGDFDRIVEVLQNLCENALKYGDGKVIEISFAEEEGCELITVRNSGCHLKQEELHYIFDPFYRGSNREKAEGSGLGLYIGKELMHRMDGEIFAEIRQEEFAITVVVRKQG